LVKVVIVRGLLNSGNGNPTFRRVIPDGPKTGNPGMTSNGQTPSSLIYCLNQALGY
jgi:hypothetical protein